MKQAYSIEFGVTVQLYIDLDSKDLTDATSTKRLPIDKTINGDIESLRYDSEATKIRETKWVPGKFTLSDPLPKALQKTLQTGKSLISSEDAVTNYSAKLLGSSLINREHETD